MRDFNKAGDEQKGLKSHRACRISELITEFIYFYLTRQAVIKSTQKPIHVKERTTGNGKKRLQETENN